MREFPTSEITRIKLYAKVFPIFAAIGVPGLVQLDPFTVIFMFVDLVIAVIELGSSFQKSVALREKAALFMPNISAYDPRTRNLCLTCLTQQTVH